MADTDLTHACLAAIAVLSRCHHHLEHEVTVQDAIGDVDPHTVLAVLADITLKVASVGVLDVDNFLAQAGPMFAGGTQ